ncbi:MAG TPA: hypothetical protein VF881_12350, partial [Polyangiaceae bacterium]
MMRDGLTAGAKNVYMLASPTASNNYRWQVRSAAGGSTTSAVPSSTACGNGTAPVWVKITRSGSTLTGSCSANGTSWTQVGTTTINMSSTLEVGLAVTSHVNGTLATGTFDSVSVSSASCTPTTCSALGKNCGSVSDGCGGTLNCGTCPSGQTCSASNQCVTSSVWSSQDVGTVSAAGSFSQSSGTYTVNGSGADIWGSADAFRYVYQNLSGDVSVTARLAAVQNVNTWTKAGVMMRDGLAAGATNVAMVASPTAANNYRWQVRSAAGGSTTSAVPPTTACGNGTAPVWVRITRSGSTLTGFCSPDGSSWTQVGTTTISMSSTLQVGLAVTSHLDGTLAAGTFDNVSVSSAICTPTTCSALGKNCGSVSDGCGGTLNCGT